jgi:hypothetical protein
MTAEFGERPKMTAGSQHSFASKTSVFGVLDEAPMTPVRYFYWLLASGGTFLDGFAVVSLGIGLPLLKRDFSISPVVSSAW